MIRFIRKLNLALLLGHPVLLLLLLLLPLSILPALF